MALYITATFLQYLLTNLLLDNNFLSSSLCFLLLPLSSLDNNIMMYRKIAIAYEWRSMQLYRCEYTIGVMRCSFGKNSLQGTSWRYVGPLPSNYLYYHCSDFGGYSLSFVQRLSSGSNFGNTNKYHNWYYNTVSHDRRVGLPISIITSNENYALSYPRIKVWNARHTSFHHVALAPVFMKI